MNKSPRFVFFGTPDFSVRILDVLDSHGLLPSLVVTAPDRPRGRGQALQPTPVKSWALERNIPVLTPEKLDAEFSSQLSTHNSQLLVVAAYGLIISKSVLDIPKYGALNVHPSLLPKYRGASPIESQILADEEDIGVTIMKMDEKMDHGPILAQTEIRRPRLLPDALELEKILADAGGELLAETMVAYAEKSIVPQEQDHGEATFTQKITKSDAKINLSDNPHENFLKIQAYKRFRPHFFATSGGKEIRVVITKASFDTKTGTLVIERVIPEGGKEMPFSDFEKKYSG